jgi:hypothetical protein
MFRFLAHVQRLMSLRGSVGALPGWAKWALAVLALPGLFLVALSIVALAVSILALLLFTVPAYHVLAALTGALRRDRGGVMVDSVVVESTTGPEAPTSGRRHVDVTIIE